MDFHTGKLDLELLVWMDKLKGILKLYTEVGLGPYVPVDPLVFIM